MPDLPYEAAPSTYARATWLFLRLLGLVYLIAFWSLGVQIRGLVGHDGILPADQYMAGARALMGLSRFWLLPTLAWAGTSDGFLQALCISGGALAALLMTGILPSAVLPLLWLIYLSLSIVCRDFLAFQWDTLLLETGFLAIFLAPLTRRERLHSLVDPPPVAVWLMLWLLFRLMVGSGAVKLTSGDPAWRNLTALAFHFETQPIPTPVAWYAHRLPLWFLKVSTIVMFAIEICVPFLIVAPRRLRALAFVPLVGFQALIALTGNYAFFNLLTAALCLFLLDDAALGDVGRVLSDPALRRVQKDPPYALLDDAALGDVGRVLSDPALRRVQKDPPYAGTGVAQVFRPRVRGALVLAVAVVTVPVSAIEFTGALGIGLPGAALIDPLANVIAPFRSVNAYGLFAVMTTARSEIILEGSEDGATWVEYEFRYKAGDAHRRPPWVAPHQPRLDWQMWFAALGRFDDNEWFQNLCVRLLEADGEVLRLLERDPFQGRKPRFIRAMLYRYRFSDAETGKRGGVWWTRERSGEYSPILSLNGK